MASIRVTHLCADRYKLETRGHTLLVDEQRADTIEIGPTPVELLVMAIASSAARDAVAYLRDHGHAHEDLRVDCTWTTEGTPPRLGRIELSLTPSIWLRPEDYAGMLAAVDVGVVHNTLRWPPAIELITPAVPARH